MEITNYSHYNFRSSDAGSYTGENPDPIGSSQLAGYLPGISNHDANVRTSITIPICCYTNMFCLLVRIENA